MAITAWCFVAAGTPAAPAGPALGSPEFRPTPARPVGWRGDWTGRFGGATPPTRWSRRVKGVTTELRYQADKPTGEPGPDTRALEYFTIEDWLVAGPFEAGDPVKDIDKDFLGGETDAAPARGARAGEATWQPLRVGMETQSRHDHNEGTCGESNVDFVYVFGRATGIDLAARQFPDSLDNKVAYAHTYIHSPAEAKVLLRIAFKGAAGRYWLNGQAGELGRRDRWRWRGDEVTLARGWNRLLVKISTDRATAPIGQNPWNSRWYFAAYLAPVEPISYETRNIDWMTPMTGRSMSAPIVVGDRVFVGSNISDLMCIRKSDGKVLWIRSNTPYEALTPAERAAGAVKEKIAPLVAQLDVLNDEAVEAINAAVSPQGLSSEAAAKLDDRLKAKADLEREIHKAFRRLDRRKYPGMHLNEVSASNATPCSDGTYVWWMCGGGMKGPGAHVIACFGMDGQRVWSFHEALGAPEHGVHTSPLLRSGTLICGVKKTMLALDAKTGREKWRTDIGEGGLWQNEFCGASPVPARVGGQDVVLSRMTMHRLSDGKAVAHTNVSIWGEMTPIVEGNLLINSCQWEGHGKPVSFRAVRLDRADKNGKCEVAVRVGEGDASVPVRGHSPAVFTVASPLYVEGIVYTVEMGGGLTAVDMASGKGLFHRWLDGYDRYNRFLYGCCASPTLAGTYVYVIDDAGYTHVLRPGRTFRELARNVIENVHLAGRGGNPCKQESFYSSPWFEGRSMYLRGEQYLYCIRRK